MAKNHSLQTIADLRPGDHLCCLYETSKEHQAVITPFLLQGLKRGEKVIYIMDAHNAETILGYLRDDPTTDSGQDLDIESYLSRGQLILLTQSDVYTREGVFDPVAMIELIRRETEQALADGYSALRVTGEMTWALSGVPGAECLIEYEARLNEFFPGSKCLAICQYDRSKFDQAVLMDVLRTHPHVVIGTEVYNNVYYCPPAELLGDDHSRAGLDQWLQNLAERKNIIETLEMRTHDLDDRVKELSCLYGIYSLVEEPGISLADILKAAVALIPLGWQCPEITEARITLDGNEYKTENFRETTFKQLSDIIVHGERIGMVEVCYMEEKPESDEGPFLKEERRLINSIAEHLGRLVEHKQTEDGLWGQFTFVSTLLESLTHPFYVVDVNDYTIKMANSATGLGELTERFTCYALNYNRDEPCEGIEHPCPLEDVKKTKEPIKVEHIHSDDDGNPQYFEIHAYPILDGEGNVVKMIEYTLDITERKQAEEAMRKSEASLAEAQRIAHLGSWEWDLATDKIFWSNEFHRVFWINPEEIDLNDPTSVRKMLSRRIHPDDYKRYRQAVDKSVQEGTPYENEFRIVLPDGSERFIYAQGVPSLDEDGTPVRIAGTALDITKRKQIEAAIRETEEKYHKLFAAVSDAIVVFDAETRRFIDVNQRALDLYGYTLEEFLALTQTDITAEPEDSDHSILETLAGKLDRIPVRFHKKKDSTIFPVEISTSTYNLEGRKVLCGVIRDISERMQTEEALRESEQRYKNLFEGIDDAVIVYSSQGKFVDCNEATLQRLGYKREEFLRLKSVDIVHPDFHLVMKDNQKRIWAGETSIVESVHRCKNGAFIPVEVKARMIDYEEDFAILSVVRDISERKRAEEMLWRSEKQASAAIEAARGFTFSYDIATGKIIWGGVIEEITGYAPEEFAQVDIEGWAQRIHPEDRDEILQILQESIKTLNRATAEYRFRKKDGSYVTLSSISLTERENGKPVRLMGILQDITERKQVEEEIEKSRQQLRNLARYLQAGREEERAKIAREIHDEFGQRLTALKMDLAWLSKRLPQEHSHLSEKTGEMSDMIDSTIQLVRRISTELRPGLLDDLGLAAALEWQADEFRDRTEIDCELHLSDQEIALDRELTTSLFRIFQETLTNIARHAQATKIYIDLESDPDEVVLMVRDNGIGITTSQVADHHSLGLIGMRERIQYLGGEVTFRGISGEGTTVTVRVPKMVAEEDQK